MSSILAVQPATFGSDPRITKDNKFISEVTVSTAQQSADEAMAFQLLEEIRSRARMEGIDSIILKNAEDRRGATLYADKGDAIFPNNSISFHNFTDKAGTIIRRVVILYPMSTYRQGELPKCQLLDKLEQAANEEKIDLIDLRAFQEEGRCLEGTGAINFSYDGRFAYMSRSSRTDDEIFDIVCSPENLCIPPENRFVFSAAMPRKDGKGSDPIYHTNVVGWCGKGICAWALDLLIFDNEKDRERFYNHLETEYKTVLALTAAEVRAFCGNALEVSCRRPDGGERHFLCLSETAEKAHSASNKRALAEWYEENDIHPFYAEVVERRTGGSVRCTIAASIYHGPTMPAPGQETIFQVAGIEERK